MSAFDMQSEMKQVLALVRGGHPVFVYARGRGRVDLEVGSRPRADNIHVSTLRRLELEDRLFIARRTSRGSAIDERFGQISIISSIKTKWMLPSSTSVEAD